MIKCLSDEMTRELVGVIASQFEQNNALFRDLISCADFDGNMLVELLIAGKPDSRITALA
jgi:hypothetical protein